MNSFFSTNISFKRISYILLSIILIALLILPNISLMSRSVMIQDIPELAEAFPNAYSTITTARFDGEEARNLHYVTTGNPDGQLLIFIHGAPGDWQTFRPYLEDPELLEQFRMISVDRPGYGLSDLGNVERSPAQQAKLISLAVSENQSVHDPIIVGHSFGGPVVTRMIMDQPDTFAHGIILAGPLDPAEEEKPWWEHVAHFPPVRWILPKDIFVTSEEIYTLEGELEEMLPLWETINTPMTIVHGTEDSLVPVANATFISDQLSHTPHTVDIIEGQNHFIPWNEYDRIKALILRVSSPYDPKITPLPPLQLNPL